MHLVIAKLAFEVASVLPFEQTLAMLLTIDVLTGVGCTVDPVLFALSVMLVVLPVTFVGGSVRVEVGSFTIGFVVFPVANVDVTVGMDDATESFLPVVDEVSVESGAIWPDLRAFAMSDSA